jgi:hypothetical protein
MYILQSEVGGNQQFVTGRKAQNRAVVPNPGYDGGARARLTPDPTDQRFFAQWQTF